MVSTTVNAVKISGPSRLALVAKGTEAVESHSNPAGSESDSWQYDSNSSGLVMRDAMLESQAYVHDSIKYVGGRNTRTKSDANRLSLLVVAMAMRDHHNQGDCGADGKQQTKDLRLNVPMSMEVSMTGVEEGQRGQFLAQRE